MRNVNSRYGGCLLKVIVRNWDESCQKFLTLVASYSSAFWKVCPELYPPFTVERCPLSYLVNMLFTEEMASRLF